MNKYHKFPAEQVVSPLSTLHKAGLWYDLQSGCGGEYTVAYHIPTTGTGTTATDALTDMFSSAGGTFTGTPSINTTYYLSNTNTVVG